MTELSQLLCICGGTLHLIQWATGFAASEDGQVQNLILVVEEDMRVVVWSRDVDDVVPCLILLEGPGRKCESQEVGCRIKE